MNPKDVLAAERTGYSAIENGQKNNFQQIPINNVEEAYDHVASGINFPIDKSENKLVNDQTTSYRTYIMDGTFDKTISNIEDFSTGKQLPTNNPDHIANIDNIQIPFPNELQIPDPQFNSDEKINQKILRKEKVIENNESHLEKNENDKDIPEIVNDNNNNNNNNISTIADHENDTKIVDNSEAKIVATKKEKVSIHHDLIVEYDGGEFQLISNDKSIVYEYKKNGEITMYNEFGFQICGEENRAKNFCMRATNCPFHCINHPNRPKGLSRENVVQLITKLNNTTIPLDSSTKMTWSLEDEKRFFVGLCIFGRSRWREISEYMKPVSERTPSQVQSHAQKVFVKMKTAGIAIPPKKDNNVVLNLYMEYKKNTHAFDFYVTQNANELSQYLNNCVHQKPSALKKFQEKNKKEIRTLQNMANYQDKLRTKETVVPPKKRGRKRKSELLNFNQPVRELNPNILIPVNEPQAIHEIAQDHYQPLYEKSIYSDKYEINENDKLDDQNKNNQMFDNETTKNIGSASTTPYIYSTAAIDINKIPQISLEQQNYSGLFEKSKLDITGEIIDNDEDFTNQKLMSNLDQPLTNLENISVQKPQQTKQQNPLNTFIKDEPILSKSYDFGSAANKTMGFSLQNFGLSKENTVFNPNLKNSLNFPMTPINIHMNTQLNQNAFTSLPMTPIKPSQNNSPFPTLNINTSHDFSMFHSQLSKNTGLFAQNNPKPPSNFVHGSPFISSCLDFGNTANILSNSLVKKPGELNEGLDNKGNNTVSLPILPTDKNTFGYDYNSMVPQTTQNPSSVFNSSMPTTQKLDGLNQSK